MAPYGRREQANPEHWDAFKDTPGKYFKLNMYNGEML